MPRGDGTGPIGMGPMTGWKMGFCQKNRVFLAPRARCLFSNGFNQSDNTTQMNLENRKRILEEELRIIDEQLKK